MYDTLLAIKHNKIHVLGGKSPFTSMAQDSTMCTHMAGTEFILHGTSGKRTLRGTLPVMGAKNAVLPLLASAILFEDGVIFENVPMNADVKASLELLAKLGITAEVAASTVHTLASRLTLSCAEVQAKGDLDQAISRKMRASIMMTGPALARFGRVSFPKPGGCVIGARPIDLFIDGFERMGATLTSDDDTYVATAPHGLVGTELFFGLQSVSATETFMMAAVLARGTTVLKNAAMEPEIVTLAEHLVAAGANITGAGTSTITIVGRGGSMPLPAGALLVNKGRVCTVIPDRIEAGSFLFLAALVGADIAITQCRTDHLESVIHVLKQAGVPLIVREDSIRVNFDAVPGSHSPAGAPLSAVSIRTHEYPGFPTDLQPQLVVFLTACAGEAVVFETIFEGRLSYVPGLTHMGASLTVFDPHRLQIKGPTPLVGAEVDAPDIRAAFLYLKAIDSLMFLCYN
jgi:UDP-N-acetylglucosamine 1-carboxyvinyltransferase